MSPQLRDTLVHLRWPERGPGRRPHQLAPCRACAERRRGISWFVGGCRRGWTRPWIDADLWGCSRRRTGPGVRGCGRRLGQ
eukprot:7283477-Alexandrium_andersonii.AAC.1